MTVSPSSPPNDLPRTAPGASSNSDARDSFDWDSGRRVLTDLSKVDEHFSAVGQWTVSPDGEHVAAPVDCDDGQQVCVDGTVWEPVYEKAWHLAYSPDGRLTALVRLDDQWTVAVDGHEWPERFDFVWNTKFSVDGAVIAAQVKRDTRHTLAIDGVAWEVDFLSCRDYVLSEDGRHAAAAVQVEELAEADIAKFMDGTWSVVVDGVLWAPRFVNAYDPHFSHDGAHVAVQVRTAAFEYTIAEDGKPWSDRFGCVWSPQYRRGSGAVVAPVRTQGAWVLAENGKPLWGNRFVQLWHVCVGPDDKRIAAVVAPQFGRWTVAVDGVPWPCTFESVVLAPRFSPDGARVAAAARHGGKWTMVVDGAPWSACFDRIGDPVFVGGSVVARVEVDGKHRLARDGRVVGSNWDWLWEPIASPDGKRVLIRGIADRHHVREVVALSDLGS